MSHEIPIVTEIPKELEPVDRDTFIDDLGRIALIKDLTSEEDSDTMST